MGQHLQIGCALCLAVIDYQQRGNNPNHSVC